MQYRVGSTTPSNPREEASETQKGTEGTAIAASANPWCSNNTPILRSEGKARQHNNTPHHTASCAHTSIQSPSSKKTRQNQHTKHELLAPVLQCTYGLCSSVHMGHHAPPQLLSQMSATVQGRLGVCASHTAAAVRGHHQHTMHTLSSAPLTQHQPNPHLQSTPAHLPNLEDTVHQRGYRLQQHDILSITSATANSSSLNVTTLGSVDDTGGVAQLRAAAAATAIPNHRRAAFAVGRDWMS